MSQSLGKLQTVSIMDTLSELVQEKSLKSNLINNNLRAIQRSAKAGPRPKPRSPRVKVIQGEHNPSENEEQVFSFIRNGNIDALSERLRDLDGLQARRLLDVHKNNLVHLGCLEGDVRVLNLVRNKMGSDKFDEALKENNENNRNPVQIAVKANHVACLQWLMRQSDQVKPGQLLHLAAKYGQSDVARWLLERHLADPRASDARGNSLLHVAAAKGHVALVQMLLLNGADIHAKNRLNLTALDVARVRQQSECADLLVMFATSLSITQRMLTLKQTWEATQTHFEELTAAAKALVREREEMNSLINDGSETSLKALKEMLNSKNTSEKRVKGADEGFRRLEAQLQTSLFDENIAFQHIKSNMSDTEQLLASKKPSGTTSTLNTELLPSSSSESECDSQLKKKRVMRRARRNIAFRKKMATPCPSESVYSSVSNVYCKIHSPLNSSINVEEEEAAGNEESNSSGTARVLEVIEPTSSEEELFKKAMQEVDLPWNVFKAKNECKPEPSPTRRLLEMGVSIDDLEEAKEDSNFVRHHSLGNIRSQINITNITETNNTSNEEQMEDKTRRSIGNTFWSRIAKGTSDKWRRASARGSKTNLEKDLEVEEHVLPDNLDDDEDNNEDNDEGNNERTGVVVTTEATSLTTSEDSGVFVATTNNVNVANNSNGGPKRMMVRSASLQPLSFVMHRSLETKAWYEVPSEEELDHDYNNVDDQDEKEVNEDNPDESLASIISVKGVVTSDDEEDEMELRI